MKSKIAELPKGSKRWWKLNRQLLERKHKISSIPPLKDGETWIKDPDAKANLFAKIFDKKAELPPEEIDCPYFGMPDMEF